ncbi:MAG: 50S ribosomal protein L34 [Candidatus Staskawiczbacteria bacterium]|nr:50S ribosomal protein L34 [Candidatus Staskawiczbacteria bacterium]
MSKTYKPKKKKRANTHGFLRRKKTRNGKKVVQNRRRKGRAKLTVSK